MRAGAFSEKRVIDLLNRRFVTFYYNRSGVGLGGDADASRFVTGKTRNKYAFFAAFDNEGKWLGETELYADKDSVFEFLIQLSTDHPQYFAPTSTERSIQAKKGSLKPSEKMAAASLAEELGQYSQALELYADVAKSTDALDYTARLSTMRIHRYLGDWKQHQACERELINRLGAKPNQVVRAEMAVEKAHRLLHEKKYAAVLDLLRPHCFDSVASGKIADIHMLCGRANWFLGARNWAKFHFCWIVEKTPESHLARRAYIAAAAEAMPYENPSLGGYRADIGNIGTSDIVRGYDGAKVIYEAMKAKFSSRDWSSAAPQGPKGARAKASPFLLVAKLVDGNTHRIRNNQIVAKLERLGKEAVPVLIAAIDDQNFPGRGYAAWALSQVMKSNKIDDAKAKDTLRVAVGDHNPYVSALARSGLGTLR